MSLQHSTGRPANNTANRVMSEVTCQVSEVRRDGALMLQEQVNGSLHVLHHVTWLHQVRLQDQISVTMKHRLCDCAALVAWQRRTGVIDTGAHLGTGRAALLRLVIITGSG